MLSGGQMWRKKKKLSLLSAPHFSNRFETVKNGSLGIFWIDPVGPIFVLTFFFVTNNNFEVSKKKKNIFSFKGPFSESPDERLPYPLQLSSVGGTRAASRCSGPVLSVFSTRLGLTFRIFWPIWKKTFFAEKFHFEILKSEIFPKIKKFLW